MTLLEILAVFGAVVGGLVGVVFAYTIGYGAIGIAISAGVGLVIGLAVMPLLAGPIISILDKGDKGANG